MSQTETSSASREMVPYAPPAPRSTSERFSDFVCSNAFKTAVVGLALVAGWAAGTASTRGDRSPSATESAAQIERLRLEIAELRDTQTGQLEQDRQAVTIMRAGIEELQRTTASNLIQLSSAANRAEADRLADFSKLAERMARIEKQISDTKGASS